ncbi:hypothetical protein BT93_F2227 [Corymbia citriodora subsp. variegata]|nr:hypothetical protein BT93_F2227 [Corymbia citriodora subsp. variegata]KAF8025320.1 hypothetical protein BT93_F2227 [Corymbia citriodora subsp. variegata]
MSGFENIVGGKLKLKGKALDVKAGGVKKKKKQKKQHQDSVSEVIESELSAGEGAGLSNEPNEEDINDESKLSEEGKAAPYDHQLTPAEKRYIEQREQIDVKRLAKKANKSHRDRIQDFNQYLANMSEHYDIPKVGPG